MAPCKEMSYLKALLNFYNFLLLKVCFYHFHQYGLTDNRWLIYFESPCVFIMWSLLKLREFLMYPGRNVWIIVSLKRVIMLNSLVRGMRITICFVCVHGHNSVYENEIADFLAKDVNLPIYIKISIPNCYWDFFF